MYKPSFKYLETISRQKRHEINSIPLS